MATRTQLPRRAARMSAPPVNPPYAGPDAIDPSDMATKFTLRTLNNEGYINSHSSIALTPGELAKAYGHGTILRYADEAKGHRELDEPFHIHPCLQRDQWEDMDDDGDWDAILPSVELASRFLDDPGITPFFAGLMGGNMGRLDDDVLEKRHGKKFKRWDYDNSIMQSEEVMEDALYAMMALRKKMVLMFDESDHYGETGWEEPEKQCVTTLNEQFLHILRKDPGFQAQRWSQPWVPGTDEESARLRTRYILAVTIVHEFAHCAWQIKKKGNKVEPYLRDSPYNELGYELEKMIFSGMINATGEPHHISAPYGLYIERYPGQWTTSKYPRGSPEDWGVTWCTDYPVHMDFVEKMFTKDFWDEQVARFGFASCRPERKKGVRSYEGYPVKADPLEAGLSPKSLALHQLKKDRRAKVIRAAIEADDTDTSDKEDEDADDFVIRGSHKIAVEAARRAAETDEDGDVDMDVAP